MLAETILKLTQQGFEIRIMPEEYGPNIDVYVGKDGYRVLRCIPIHDFETSNAAKDLILSLALKELASSHFKALQ